MAVTASPGKNGCIYINGYDLSDNFQTFEFGRTAEVFEANSFRSTAKRYVEGLPDSTISGEGIWDPTAGQMDSIIDQALTDGGNHTMIYLPKGDTFGEIGYGTEAIVTDHSVSGDVADVVSTSFEAQPTVGRERLQILAPLSPALTATDVTDTLDAPFGAATSAGAVGYLMVSDVAGSGTIDVIIETDTVTPVATPTTIITFTQVTAANAHERIALDTDVAVERYVRATITISGFTSANVFVGFNRR